MDDLSQSETGLPCIENSMFFKVELIYWPHILIQYIIDDFTSSSDCDAAKEGSAINQAAEEMIQRFIVLLYLFAIPEMH